MIPSKDDLPENDEYVDRVRDVIFGNRLLTIRKFADEMIISMNLS